MEIIPSSVALQTNELHEKEAMAHENVAWMVSFGDVRIGAVQSKEGYFCADLTNFN